MKHYVIQTHKSFGHFGIQPQAGYDSRYFAHWHNTYILTRDVPDPQNAGAYVNGIVQAEQFVTPGAVTRASVFEMEPGETLAPYTKARAFIDRSSFPDSLDVYQGARFGGQNLLMPLDLHIGWNRRTGRDARREIRGQVASNDLYIGAFKTWGMPRLVLDGKSNLEKWWGAWFVYQLSRLPGLDYEGSWKDEITLSPTLPRVGETLIKSITFNAGRYRYENTTNSAERNTRLIIERAMMLAALALTQYHAAMTTFKMNWGDGYFPDLAPAVQNMTWAAGCWYVLARALGLSGFDTLGRTGADGIAAVLGFPQDYSTRVNIKAREGVPLACIDELWQLSRYVSLNPFPIPRAQPCSTERPVPQSSGGCMPYDPAIYPQYRALYERFWNQSRALYERMDELTKWLFAVQNVLCVLDATWRIQHPIRREKNALRERYHAKDVQFLNDYSLRHLGALDRAREYLGFDLRYPVMTEIIPIARGPFLTFHHAPTAPPSPQKEDGITVPPATLKKRCPFRWNPTTDYDTELATIYEARAVNAQRGCRDEERARYEQHINLKLSDSEWNWLQTSRGAGGPGANP